ncbi:TPA: ArsR family transcriptional regulator [Candidatus Poribacteria bacterium]|nr:ArsR family transcriptional regulator [Candidatus Poribacteria bacterium]
MGEEAADGRDATTASSTKRRSRPATPKIRLGDACLKNYLVLRVLRELSAYDLALRYISGIEGFCSALTEALGCGALAARLFMVMYLHGGEWTCSELARKTGRCRQNIHKALRRLEEAGLAVRASRHRWTLAGQSAPF